MKGLTAMNATLPILFVYHDRRIAQLCIQKLREAGFDVVVTDNHTFARQLLAVPEQPFKVVVAEMMMPSLDLSYKECGQGFGTGLVLAEMIRQHQHNTDVRIILISGAEEFLPKLIYRYHERLKSAGVEKILRISVDMAENLAYALQPREI
jgi:CheY-like chemotaxis protein